MMITESDITVGKKLPVYLWFTVWCQFLLYLQHHMHLKITTNT